MDRFEKLFDEDKIIGFFKDKIFSKFLPPSEFENRINEIIRDKKRRTLYELAQAFTIVSAILLLIRFGFRLWALIPILAIVIFVSVFLDKNIKKYKRFANLLVRARSEIRKDNFSVALDFMLEAYKLYNHEGLLKLIYDFIQQHPPTAKQDLLITELSTSEPVGKTTDKKMIEIINQINVTKKYILKHKELIVTSTTKINELRLKLTGAPQGRLQAEYSSLIKRYEDIVELENAKIDFYEKAKHQLLALKQDHIISQQLIKEKEELRTLEDSLLEKSTKELYSNDSINDFITYENAYLEAINEYSEKISATGDHNLFEDIISSFKTKTQIL